MYVHRWKRDIQSKIKSRLANSVDSDETARVVSSGSTLFAIVSNLVRIYLVVLVSQEVNQLTL